MSEFSCVLSIECRSSVVCLVGGVIAVGKKSGMYSTYNSGAKTLLR